MESQGEKDENKFFFINYKKILKKILSYVRIVIDKKKQKN